MKKKLFNSKKVKDMSRDLERNISNVSQRVIQKKKTLSKPALIIIVGLIIILIPCAIFGGILLVSALQTGSPREGSRFKNDLVEKISNSDIKDLEDDLKSLSSVEDVTVKESQGQLKVFIDVDDSLNESTVDEVVNQTYSKVTQKFPIKDYFTKTDTSKMYDLQINVYTTLEAESGRVYKYLHKNSSEETYAIDDLANPKDPATALQVQGLQPEHNEDVEIDENVEIEDVEDLEQ